MIQILIKSFNRPFYLDRCLQSILQYVKGTYKILILDDGTPEKYLRKIAEKYPAVEIFTSAQYNFKVKAIRDNIEKGTEINGFSIPSKLWFEKVQNADDYVLVTEDDVWFTSEINLGELVAEMTQHKIELLKLGWLGNYSDQAFLKNFPLTDNITSQIPEKLFTANEFLMDCFMFNRFKFFTILYKLGIVDNFTARKYWALNSIAMGIYKKDYWLHIWKDSREKVDEKQQLRNAATYYHKKKSNKNFIAQTKEEVLKTTFQSSATNSYHKYDLNFDVNYFNYLINEAWLVGDFDAMQNFPYDVSLDYFDRFLNHKINKEEFHKWVAQFKSQYSNLGAEVN